MRDRLIVVFFLTEISKCPKHSSAYVRMYKNCVLHIFFQCLISISSWREEKKIESMKSFESLLKVASDVLFSPIIFNVLWNSSLKIQLRFKNSRIHMRFHERLWLHYVLGGLMQLSHDNINQNENWPKLVIIKGKQLDYKST